MIFNNFSFSLYLPQPWETVGAPVLVWPRSIDDCRISNEWLGDSSGIWLGFCKDYCRLAAVCLKEEVEVMAFLIGPAEK